MRRCVGQMYARDSPPLDGERSSQVAQYFYFILAIPAS